VLDQVATASRVPAEFIGLARQFRSQVKLVDAAMDRALDIITAPLRERLRRKRRLRAETLPDLARQYERLIPTEFRIGRVDGVKDRTEFAIAETRICGSWLRDDGWNSPDVREPGLSICTFVLSVREGRLRVRWTPRANVSLHAMARHVERHEDRSQAILAHDLSLLADARDDGAERVDTRGGFWLGSVIDAHGDAGSKLRLRHVRTWIGTDG
jgi:hypothetical protein